MLDCESGFFHLVGSDHVGQVVPGQEVIKGLVSEHVPSSSSKIVDESGLVNPDVGWKTAFQLVWEWVIP